MENMSARATLAGGGSGWSTVPTSPDKRLRLDVDDASDGKTVRDPAGAPACRDFAGEGIVDMGRRTWNSHKRARLASHREIPFDHGSLQMEAVMSKSLFFCAMLLLSLPFVAFSQTSIEAGHVLNIDLLGVDAGLGSFTNAIGNQATLYRFRSGLSLYYNPTSRVFCRLDGKAYWSGTDTGWTVAGSVGYAIEKDYYPSRPYTNVFVYDQYIGGGWIERSTTVVKGTCQSITARIIEAGIEKQFLNRYDEEFPYGNVYEVNQWESIDDTILFIGYRWANYYTESIAMEAFTLYAHGLLGFKDRSISTDTYEYGSGLVSTTGSDRNVALGADIGISWYIVTASLQLYNAEFLLYLGINIPLTFIFR